jgi:hypothetical protein
VTKDQERTVMVVLAIAGAAHQIYIRQRVADHMTGGDSSRAAAYHGAMQCYRKAAEFFGRQALRAEASYWREVERTHG